MGFREGVLGLLAERPMHGYDVRAEFERLTGGLWQVNIGQVYATLQRLERDGFVEPVGERGDRGRLSYELTSPGRAELATWLSTPDNDPHEVREAVYLKLLLALRVGEPVRPLLTAQRRVYRQRLRDLAEASRHAQEAQRDDLVLLLRGASLHAEADLRWLEECTAQLPSTRPGGR